MADTLSGMFASFSGANEEFYEELEESMILADIGVETSLQGRGAAAHRREASGSFSTAEEIRDALTRYPCATC